ncbi:MAG: hypothetical protein ACRCXT_11965 [Paraclostridium sp.]
MVKHILTNSVTFATLETKDPNSLYFLNDTNEIFKGDKSFTDHVIFTDTLPEFGVKGKIYINELTLATTLWNGTEWKTIVPEIHNALTDDTIQDGIATAEATKEYVRRKISEIVAGGEIDLNADNVVTTKDIIVKGQTLGSYNDGDVIPAGEKLSVILAKQFAKQIPPTYTRPTLSISPGSANHEVGSTVTLNVNSSFTQRDGGALERYVLVKTVKGVNDTLLDQATIAAVPQADVIVEEGTNVKYKSQAYYADGVIKNDNLGQPYPTGSIKAGNISAEFTLTGQRKAFYGKGKETIACANSAEVRALAQSVLNPGNGTKLTVALVAGDVRVTFAYPANLRDVTSVISSALNMDVKGTFEKQEIEVEGANGYAATKYKVYTYIPAIPFASNDTYTITI